jgi:hypothetical protein
LAASARSNTKTDVCLCQAQGASVVFFLRFCRRALRLSIRWRFFATLFCPRFLSKGAQGLLAEQTAGTLFARPLECILVAAAYWGLAFIATFFNVCVVYTRKTRFEGGDATFMVPKAAVVALGLDRHCGGNRALWGQSGIARWRFSEWARSRGAGAFSWAKAIARLATDLVQQRDKEASPAVPVLSWLLAGAVLQEGGLAHAPPGCSDCGHGLSRALRRPADKKTASLRRPGGRTSQRR